MIGKRVTSRTSKRTVDSVVSCGTRRDYWLSCRNNHVSFLRTRPPVISPLSIASESESRPLSPDQQAEMCLRAIRCANRSGRARPQGRWTRQSTSLPRDVRSFNDRYFHLATSPIRLLSRRSDVLCGLTDDQSAVNPALVR